jgi:hypothetical protein
MKGGRTPPITRRRIAVDRVRIRRRRLRQPPRERAPIVNRVPSPALRSPIPSTSTPITMARMNARTHRETKADRTTGAASATRTAAGRQRRADQEHQRQREQQMARQTRTNVHRLSSPAVRAPGLPPSPRRASPELSLQPWNAARVGADTLLSKILFHIATRSCHVHGFAYGSTRRAANDSVAWATGPTAQSCAYKCAYRLAAGRLLSLQLGAISNQSICSAFPRGSERCSSRVRTSNPRVGGSNPPGRIAGCGPGVSG